MSNSRRPPSVQRAAAYYRMSTDRQDESIDRQRSQVEPFAAKNGFHIVREYLDEGIAGDEEGRRKGFMAMLADAQKGEFTTILCDDKDRFGRFDSITQGYYVHPLRRAGVAIVTVAQGRLDWESFAGRITDAVLMEAKKLESLATSRRVTTKMLMMAKQGKWLGGRPPYGYAATVDPIVGKKLVPGDPEKIAAVRLMFDMYGNHGATLDTVVEELAKQSIRGPRGLLWDKTTVRQILRNHKYIGCLTWNCGHDGKYSSVKDGDVRTSDGRTPKWNNAPADWVIVANTHEALIDQQLFDRVQTRLVANQKYTTPNKKKDFPLTGLLVCANCGWKMIGNTQGGKRYYMCGSYHSRGKVACTSNHIQEARVLGCLVDKLQAAVQAPEIRAAVLKRVRELATAEQPDAAATARLERQVNNLTRKIDKGVENMALVGPDLIGDVQDKVRAWKTERDRLSLELERLRRPNDDGGPDRILAAVERILDQLRECVARADGRLVRELLQQMVSRIELRFKKVPKKGKVSAVFTQGTIYLRPQTDPALSSHLLSGGRPDCR